jgi:hypothetical protein
VDFGAMMFSADYSIRPAGLAGYLVPTVYNLP